MNLSTALRPIKGLRAENVQEVFQDVWPALRTGGVLLSFGHGCVVASTPPCDLLEPSLRPLHREVAVPVHIRAEEPGATLTAIDDAASEALRTFHEETY